MSSDGKGQNCGGVVTDFSIMTTLQPSELVSLAKHSITVLPHPPYRTLLHVISFCFPCSKDLYKEEDLRLFQRLRQMRRRSSQGIKKDAYLDCFRKWKHRWDKCVRWEGEYFEGDPDLSLL